MSVPYKNPISPNQLTGQQSLERTKTYGTSYSTLSTGGYMEVYSLDQLYYTIPTSTYGPIEFSGNSIPITFSKGSGTTFSFDTITLQPDNISSGRRKLGMLVYVYEQNQVYQYSINNYDSLWNAATGSTGTTTISDFGTTIKANSPENIAFISGWTANTIDGISGETYSTAVWKKYYGNNISLTGATFNSGTGVLTLTNITGGTQNLSGFGGGGGGTSITGGTFDKNTETLTLNTSGSSITITGFTDVFVTGGTYNNNIGTATFTNNSGGTFNVSGFLTSSTFTGGTVSGATNFTNGLTANTISATTYQNLPFIPTNTYVQLTANTTTTNLTYTDVAGMSITLSTTGTYQIEIFALTLKNNNAGLNLGITVPTTSTYLVNFMGQGGSNQLRTEDSVASGSLTTVAFNAVNGLNGHVRINALITITATGDVKLGFASVTSGTATIRTGTYMVITKIA